MTKSRVLAGGFVFVLVATVVVIGVYAQASRHSGRARNPIQGPAPKADGSIPEHIFYEHLFNSLLTLKNIDDYRSEAALNERETAEFAAIASECARELARQDAKAQVIIKDFRAKIKKLKQGEAIPPPPQELKVLQDERNAITLRHAERLRQSIGFEKFNRINEVGHGILRIEIRPAR
jgi:hypothetical protein